MTQNNGIFLLRFVRLLFEVKTKKKFPMTKNKRIYFTSKWINTMMITRVHFLYFEHNFAAINTCFCTDQSSFELNAWFEFYSHCNMRLKTFIFNGTDKGIPKNMSIVQCVSQCTSPFPVLLNGSFSF